MNRSLGEGLAALLSSQLVQSRFEEQKDLLVLSELKLARAQVNPHFLFNAINTIVAVLRRDPERARGLLVHLAGFFRKNLKRSTELSTLAEELEHVGAYLEIEKARHEGRVRVETDVDPALLGLALPSFTLQPLVENAFKHGVANVLGEGRVTVRARVGDGGPVLEVEDTGGAWKAPVPGNAGLGLQIVDKRLKNLFGAQFGVEVTCVPDALTRVSVRLPPPGA
ncbi:MAG: histidine kinase [Anaeromyxobacteraceae bacterium]